MNMQTEKARATPIIAPTGAVWWKVTHPATDEQVVRRCPHKGAVYLIREHVLGKQIKPRSKPQDDAQHVDNGRPFDR
jgi:hypothetical protein